MTESKPRAPRNLAPAGRKLWNETVEVYDLAPHEARILTDAVREADLIERLENALVGADLIVLGSMKQQVANPLIAEIRQHRATLANLLKSIKLPEPGEAPAGENVQPLGRPKTRQEASRIANKARWESRYGGVD
jgi:hypothetical protein